MELFLVKNLEVNLSQIACLEEGETFDTTGGNIKRIPLCYFTSTYRALTGDCRKRAIAMIESFIYQTKDVIDLILESRHVNLYDTQCKVISGEELAAYKERIRTIQSLVDKLKQVNCQGLVRFKNNYIEKNDTDLLISIERLQLNIYEITRKANQKIDALESKRNKFDSLLEY